MYVNFEKLSPSSRVWIYQASKTLSDHDVSLITTKLQSFVEGWKRHGEDLKASYLVKYNQFIILAVDESFNTVSGCAIDASTHIIKQLEHDLSLDLMNKLNVAFKIKDIVNTTSLKDFQQFVEAKKITKDTIVFNNMIQTKNELETSWEIPANQSWHRRYFK